VELSIASPQTFADSAHIQRFLARAEELPFVTAWCIEQVIGIAPVLESVTTLALCGRDHETASTRDCGAHY
jgi:hypothetical protein